MKRIDERKVADLDCAVGETEWAHALAGSFSVRTMEGSVARMRHCA